MTPKRNHWKALHTYALSLPGAYEEHPWGESVAKVSKKVFAFLGRPGEETPKTIALKLRAAHGFALSLPGASETGYGLGRAGWVSVPVASGVAPLAVLRELVDESYALVAPKRPATVMTPKSRPNPN